MRRVPGVSYPLPAVAKSCQPPRGTTEPSCGLEGDQLDGQALLPVLRCGWRHGLPQQLPPKNFCSVEQGYQILSPAVLVTWLPCDPLSGLSHRMVVAFAANRIDVRTSQEGLPRKQLHCVFCARQCPTAGKSTRSKACAWGWDRPLSACGYAWEIIQPFSSQFLYL